MSVRVLTAIEKESKQSEGKLFTLKATEKFVGIRDKSSRRYPHFPIRLSIGEEILMGDLSFKVLSACLETRIVSVSVSPASDESSLDLDDIRMKGPKLRIGDIA